MDSLCLVALAADLQHRLVGRRLGAVVVPRREQVVIGAPDGALLISIEPAAARVHLVPSLPPSPRPEPSIQTHLDSLLRGAEVTAVRAPNFDRVLHLDVHGLDRVGNPRSYTLIVELMGKHSAFVVIDPEGQIVATLKTVTRAVNRYRELLARQPYLAPPDGGRRNPLTLDRAAWDALWPRLTTYPSLREGWRANLFGLSNELWAWLVAEGAEAGQDAAWAALAKLQDIVSTNAWQPSLRRDAAGLAQVAWPLPLPGAEPLADLQAGWALVASQAQERGQLGARRGDLVGAVSRTLHRVESRLKGHDRALARAAQADEWQHEADLLLANVHRIQPHTDSVTVEDWAQDGAPRTIALDPRQAPARQAEERYERARRARRAVTEQTVDRDALAADVAELQGLLTALKAAGSLDELEALAEPYAERLAESQPQAAAGRDKPRTERERWLRRLERRTSSDGYTILIGRNAAESEGLLSRVAAPSDLWFHVRGAGSGHVIVRSEGRPEAVPPRTIEEAARWAARASRMKHSSLVPVVYTQRKYVTKVTGGAAGKVVYRHEQSIFVEP